MGLSSLTQKLVQEGVAGNSLSCNGKFEFKFLHFPSLNETFVVFFPLMRMLSVRERLTPLVSDDNGLLFLQLRNRDDVLNALVAVLHAQRESITVGPNSPMLDWYKTRSSMACLAGLLPVRILPYGAGWRDLPAHDSKILKIRVSRLWRVTSYVRVRCTRSKYSTVL